MKPEADALAPQWSAPLAGVRARCSTRLGGTSAAPYHSLNLGDHVGDAPHHVAANRQRWQQQLGVRPVYLQQVHGRGCVLLQPHTPDGVQADVAVADAPGVAATVMVADCLPVLLAHRSGRAVAAAHAGWRGLAGGVLEAALAALLARSGGAAHEVLAWLGPCIGPQAFEVGSEVRAAFVARGGDAETAFVPAGTPGKYWADLPALARLRLQAAGVRQVAGNDGSRAWCTHAQASRFFSHRRDGVSGRLAASIWIEPGA